MQHTLSVLVKNESGTLSSISGLFSGRGYNIESLTVAPCVDTDFSRVTIVTSGDDRVIEQITKQLNRLINTIKIIEVTPSDSICREMILCKIHVKDENRSEVIKAAEMLGAKIIDVTGHIYTIEAMGNPRTVKSFIELVRPLGLKELVRSGKVAISHKIAL